VDAGLAQVDELVRSGNWPGAASQLDQLETYAAKSPRVQQRRQLVRCVQSANNLTRHGKFADAEAQWDRAVALQPDLPEIKRLREDCRDKLASSRPLSEDLYQSMAAENWQEVLHIADALLRMAPEWKLVLKARQRAWQLVGAGPDSIRSSDTGIWSAVKPASAEVTPAAPAGGRFLLWVDGVGGYLVCLRDEVVVGQHVPGSGLDIPILGDLSRRHARIRRSGEGYVIDPWQRLRINSRVTTEPVTLADGDELELGSGVRFRFRRPHALSATARLDLLSRHRTQPSADGVLLMAESCVLGPKWQNHVVCRDWSSDVVLYRHDGELFCRSVAPIEIDGQLCEGRGRLGSNTRVVGSDFSMCLEELDRCSSQPLL
jgi:hypothetical protein